MIDIRNFAGDLIRTIIEVDEEAARRGLCADRARHDAHQHESETLGLFWCTGDPDDREPYRSERRRAATQTS